MPSATLSTKITKLTPEQEELLPRWHDEWLRIGMCEQPIDRPLATAAIHRAYRLIGKSEPLIVFCESPATSSLGIAIWQHLCANRASLRDSLGASLRASLGDSLGDIANSTWFWGQMDAFCIGFYRFCEEIGVKYESSASDRLSIMEDLARSCGWIYFYKNVCFVSGRPKLRTELIERNGRKIHRLHCGDGPAMSFADGYRVYAWHGTLVPERVILSPDSYTPIEIIEERNAEVRRVMIERYGQDRFVNDAGAKVLDKGPDGELLSIDLPNDPEVRIVALRLRCPSTAAVYIIRVPPDQKSFVAAKAWTFDLKPQQYAFAQET